MQEENTKLKTIPTFIGIAIIVVVAVALFGGVFVWQYFFATWQKTPQTQSQTAGWNTYSDSVVGVTLEYPSDWTYQKFSCNLDGVAFCPLAGNSPSNCGQTCSMNSPQAPIYLYTDNNPRLTLNSTNSDYKKIYNEINATLKITTPPPQPTIATDPSTGWKIYTNSQYGFEVEYPADGSLQVGDSSELKTGNNWVYINLWTANGPAHPESKGMYIQAREPVTMHPCRDPFMISSTSSRATTEVSINGINFTKGDVSPYRDLDFEIANEYCTVHGSYVYDIVVGQYIFAGTGKGSLPSLDSDPLINQALSTFKFTK